MKIYLCILFTNITNILITHQIKYFTAVIDFYYSFSWFAGLNVSKKKNLTTNKVESRTKTYIDIKGALGLGVNVNVTFGRVK